MYTKNSNGWVDRRVKIFFSLSELKQLALRPDSGVLCVKCKRSIGLLPMHLKNLNTSIKELLNAKFTKYDVELQGVILAHKNVKLIAQSIQLGDSRSCPLEYIADIYIFKPTVGSTLSGVVNKLPKNYQYLSVLVHNIFNVTVHTSASNPLPKSAIKIGTTVSIVVTYIDFTGRLPYIKGTLNHTRYEEEENDEIVAEEQSKLSHKSHKRKKELGSILKNSPLRKATSSSDLASQEPDSTELDVNDLVDGSKSKKKKPKKKKKEKETEIQETSTLKRKRDVEDEDSPVRKKKKKSKSHKLENSNDASANSLQIPILPADESVVSKKTVDQAKRQLEFAESSPKKHKLKKLKKENGEDRAISESSSCLTDVSSGTKKKKKKKKSDREIDDLSALLLAEALENIKKEI